MASLIVARDMNGGIGYQGQLPWYAKDDLVRFQRLTRGHTIVMGVRTALTCVKNALPLRKNLVVCVDPTPELSEKLAIRGFIPVSSLQVALEADPHLFVIGGARLYEEAVRNPLITDARVTEIAGAFRCDSFFDHKFDYPEWLDASSNSDYIRVSEGPSAQFSLPGTQPREYLASIMHYRRVPLSGMAAP